jgi:biotin carboxylase
MSSGRLPLVAVVHDRGSASGLEVLSSARRLCDVVFVCDRTRSRSAEEIDRIRDLAPVCDITGLTTAESAAVVTELGVTAITTFSEYQLEFTAGLALAAGLRHHSLPVVTALTDKLRQRAVLREAGVDATRCRLVDSMHEVTAALNEIGLPAVIKPRRGAGSVDTCAVHDLATGERVLTEFLADPTSSGEFLVEEMLVGDPRAVDMAFGDYVSVESVVHDQDVQHICVTGKLPLVEPFRETGSFVPAALEPSLDSEVTALAEAAIRALGVTSGVTHTEIKLTAGGPRLIEVNGRLGGSVAGLLRRATGYDLVRTALELAMGRAPVVGELAFRQVAYRYLVHPPLATTDLVGVAGVERIRDLDGVWHVDLSTEPVRVADWRAGTTGHLGEVRGTVPDHRALGRALSAIQRELTLLCLDALTGAPFDRVRALPETARLREHAAVHPPLAVVGAFLTRLGEAVTELLDGHPACSVITGERVEQVDLQPDGVRVVSAGSGRTSSWTAHRAVLAMGGRPLPGYEQTRLLPGLTLRDHQHKLCHAAELIDQRNPVSERLLTGIRDTGKVAIVGGSHSAWSAAALILDDPRVARDGTPPELSILHRSGIRLFYLSVADAHEDGYQFDSVHDVCPASGRVNRYGGLRGTAHALARGALGLDRPAHPIHLVQLREDEPSSARAADRALAEAGAVVVATGYQAALPDIRDLSGRPLIAAIGPTGTEVTRDGHLIDTDGRAHPQLLAYGLGAGLAPSAEVGGEPSYDRRADGIWPLPVRRRALGGR